MLSATRRLGAHPRLEPYVAAVLRARTVRPALPFLTGEVTGRGERVYTVRSNGARVRIGHGSSDAATMDQAFISCAFDPPPQAASALDALGRPPRVLDLGANIGLFSVWCALRWPGAQLIAVEPLPRNVAMLRANLDLAAPAGGCEVIAAAATTFDGELTFSGDAGFSQGRILDPDEDAPSIRVAARDVFPLARAIDLLKIDIEGAEWAIVADERFATLRPPVIMFEYHPDGAPGGQWPEQSAETVLQDAGYDITRTVVEYPGAGILWGVLRQSSASTRS